jgi:hypothetical protein
MIEPFRRVGHALFLAILKARSGGEAHLRQILSSYAGVLQ